MATTESASARYSSIEDWSAAELVEGFVEGQFAAIAAVQAARYQLAAAIDSAAGRLGATGRLVYMGAGTSGRLGAQDGAELPPTFNWPYERAVTLMAGGPAAMLRAVENAEDNREDAIAALEDINIAPADVVIGIAASGSTPYVVAGLEHARKKGALTIGLFNNVAGRVGAVADLPILLDTGAEMIAGSTRMKAGSAQKAALNALSTGIMIRLGYVYRGRMVEMRPTNAKLRDRAAKMVAELAGTDLPTAQAALDDAGGTIKLATVMLFRGLSRPDAEALLAQGNGNLRKALR